MNLPAPTTKALEQSNKLKARIKKNIDKNNGSLPFSLFVQLALYDQDFGYYCSRNPFGQAGDFVTAPEITPLFAQTIAQTYIQIGGDILEIGAGSGRFMVDLLKTLDLQNCLPKNYWIIETSPKCRAAQKKLIQAEGSKYLPIINWIQDPPDNFTGLIFANEVLDALPFDCFEYQNGKFFDREIICQNNQLQFNCAKPITGRSLETLNHLAELPNSYHSEIRPNLPDFISKIAKCLKKGLLLIFDYGYSRAEYFNPKRSQGTLKCFYRHHHHANPLIWPGLQDITAHVDFTMVAESICDAGLALTGFTTQAAFLLGSGITNIATNTSNAEAQWMQAQAIKTLTLPTEMGDIIKVIAGSPDPGLELAGFSLKDCRRYL